MDRWRAGDLRARASVATRGSAGATGGEFQRIAAAFDQAAEAVEAREVALRESEARFRQIGDAIDDVLLIAEPAAPTRGLSPAPASHGCSACRRSRPIPVP